ncbi:MAG: hypothetical protein ACK44H_01580 [Candidatus Kryptonium sp.]
MTKKLASILLIFLFALFSAGCTKYAKDEEIQQLNNLKAEVEQLEKEIKAKEQEKAALQNEIAQKDQKLKELQAEKEKVQQRLQQIK